MSSRVRTWIALLAGCGTPAARPQPVAPAAVCVEYLAPHPSGYSNVVRVGGTIYIAGQLPFRADRTVAVGDPEAQVRQVWENLRALMKLAGGTLQDIVSTTTFITARETGTAVNKVRQELFPHDAPTSTKVTVAGLACEGCLVEINAIAVIETASSQACQRTH